jgi:hypothetical protein
VRSTLSDDWTQYPSRHRISLTTPSNASIRFVPSTRSGVALSRLSAEPSLR